MTSTQHKEDKDTEKKKKKPKSQAQAWTKYFLYSAREMNSVEFHWEYTWVHLITNGESTTNTNYCNRYKKIWWKTTEENQEACSKDDIQILRKRMFSTLLLQTEQTEQDAVVLLRRRVKIKQTNKQKNSWLSLACDYKFIYRFILIVFC